MRLSPPAALLNLNKILIGCLASATLLLGCGQNQFMLIPPDVPVLYHAFGDSITFGFDVLPSQAYPALVSQDMGLPLKNYAIPGYQACDVAKLELFTNAAESPTIAAHGIYSLLVGTNDVGYKGAGAYEATFRLCHQATVAWLAVPAELKVLATNPNVTMSGPGLFDTSNHWNSWTTNAAGASISFPITTTADGPIYAWPKINDNNTGTFSYAVDGVTLGTGTTKTTPLIATAFGVTDSLGFLRIPSIPAGKHVVTFTQTNGTNFGFSIVGIGAPAKVRNPRRLPTVLLGTITDQLAGGGAPCSTTDAPCLAYTQDIEADLAIFVSDGLDVRLFDTQKFMFGTASEMADPIHPNVKGQSELSDAVESVL